jgi:hypothetical protein
MTQNPVTAGCAATATMTIKDIDGNEGAFAPQISNWPARLLFLLTYITTA